MRLHGGRGSAPRWAGAPWARREAVQANTATLNQLASRTSDGDVEALGAAHETEVVAVVELELAHLVRIKVGVR